jgi:hypothetical protein
MLFTVDAIAPTPFEAATLLLRGRRVYGVMRRRPVSVR